MKNVPAKTFGFMAFPYQAELKITSTEEKSSYYPYNF